MAERDVEEAADRLQRVKALLRWQFEEGFCAPFPGVNIWRGYDFQLFTPAQLRVLDRSAWRSARPAVSLEEFLRLRALGK